jgi:hypothetical protein
MKKVVFLIYIPFTEKIETDFFFTDLIRSGIDLEYWDISDLFFNDLVISNKIERSFVRKISSYRELKSSIKLTDHEETLFIPQVTFEWKVIRLFRILTKNKCKLAFFARGALPLFPVNKRISKIFGLTPLQILRKLLSLFTIPVTKISRQTGYIKCYDYIFNAGESGLTTIGIGSVLDKQRSKIIQINSFDYDSYILTRTNPLRIVNKNYCVFLDEYLPFHPDFEMFKIDTLDPIKYFGSLNKFFDEVEKKLNLKVVIAAHPKSAYTENPFNERPIYKHKTNGLVKDCEFVMAHMSSSINYAVLYEKPILFLITKGFKDIKSSYIYSVPNYFSEVLGSSLIDCDNSLDQLPDLSKIKYDYEKYKEYKYNYLTSAASENLLSKDITLNFLKSI